MKWLVGASCVAIIASSAVYLAGQYSAYAERNAVANAIIAQAAERSAENARIQRDFKAWANAHKRD